MFYFHYLAGVLLLEVAFSGEQNKALREGRALMQMACWV